MAHFLVVDGMNLLFQMFYGMPSRIVNAQGRPIQGTLGFVGALLKILRLTQPTHAVVIFDGEHPNPRVQLDPDYKATRPDLTLLSEEDTPFSQLPDVYAALDRLGLCHRETDVCEADDWIAGYALALAEGQTLTIVSQDSDFFQLITPQVQVLRYRGDSTLLCTEDYIREKFGVAPGQYADWKAMVGDTADNIRGADKIGPKTAAALLAQFGSLEGILAHVEQVKRPSVRASLEASRHRLEVNRQLITLTPWHTLPFSPEEMAYTPTNLTTTQVLRDIGLK